VGFGGEGESWDSILVKVQKVSHPKWVRVSTHITCPLLVHQCPNLTSDNLLFLPIQFIPEILCKLGNEYSTPILTVIRVVYICDGGRGVTVQRKRGVKFPIQSDEGRSQ